MDYEKEYKKIVGKIKNAYLYALTDSTKAVLEEIFPELKESEEEEARGWLIRLLKQDIEDNNYNDEAIPDAKKALAWLEKQGDYACNEFRYDPDHKSKLYVSRDGDGKLLLHFAYPHWGDNHDFRSPNQVELNPLLFPEVKPGSRVEYIAGEVFDTIR